MSSYLLDTHVFLWLLSQPDKVALAGTLDWDHRDPFDRLLVAQAIRGAATLVTADHAVRAYPPVAVLPI